MSAAKKDHLTRQIIIAIIAAFAFAYFVPIWAMKVHIGGEIFLRLLKMMVVPLVVTSVMGGILGLGDIRKLGRPGLYTILYYFSTTVLAVVVGLAVVNIIQPGVGVVDEETLKQFAVKDLPTGDEAPTIGTILENLLLMLFTDNLFEAAVETNLLPLIVFSVIFAGMLTILGENVSGITTLIEQCNEAFMSFIMLLMRLAPIGIFCLVAARFGEARAEGSLVETIQQTGWYMMAVLIGLGIHALVTIPLIYWIFTRKNPYRFMYHMSQALLTAFSTASSSATLPVTIECAITKAKVSKRSVDFVLPLGATMNMDGTALYEAAAALFIAQVIGIDLSITQQLVVAITATLAAIGAAGIPEAGLVTMLIVLNAVGLPTEYIGLIISVDWLLDRFRTAVNSFGDSVGSAVIEKSMNGAPQSAG